METYDETKVTRGGLPRVLRVLLHPLFRPEADEKRFLAALPLAVFAVLMLWGKGWFQFLGPNPPLVVLTVWWSAYLLRFGRRLQARGELKPAIIAPAVFVGLLLGLNLYPLLS